MLNIVLAIAYLFLGWPGRYLMLNNTIAGPKFFLIVIGIFLLIRWRDLNKPVYWNYLKENIIKAEIIKVKSIKTERYLKNKNGNNHN